MPTKSQILQELQEWESPQEEYQDRGDLHALLSSQDLTETTCRHYMDKLYPFIRWLKKQAGRWSLDNVPPSVVYRYVETYVPQSHASRKMFRCAVRAYWVATGRDNPPLGAIQVPHEPRFRSRAISEEDARTLAKAAMEWEQGAEGLAVVIGLYMALRAHEIAKIQWEDFNIDRTEMFLVGKGSFPANLPVHPRIKKKLAWWEGWGKDLVVTDPRTRPGETYVFAGKPGTGLLHVTPTTVWTWCKRIAKSIDIELYTHQLRHTCLTTMNDNTGDLRTVQEFARHKDPAMTARYTRVHRRNMERALESLDYGDDDSGAEDREGMVPAEAS